VELIDHLKKAATDLISILSHPPSLTIPSLKAGDPTRNALLQIAELLKRTDNIPELQIPKELDNNTPPRVKLTPKQLEQGRAPTNPHIILLEEEDDMSIAPQRKDESPIIYNTSNIDASVLQNFSNLPKTFNTEILETITII